MGRGVIRRSNRSMPILFPALTSLQGSPAPMHPVPPSTSTVMYEYMYTNCFRLPYMFGPWVGHSAVALLRTTSMHALEAGPSRSQGEVGTHRTIHNRLTCLSREHLTRQ